MDYETLDQVGRTLAEDIVARRISPIEGAYLIAQRVWNTDRALMHEYMIFAGLESEWDAGKKSERESLRTKLEDDIIDESHRILNRGSALAT